MVSRKLEILSKLIIYSRNNEFLSKHTKDIVCIQENS